MAKRSFWLLPVLLVAWIGLPAGCGGGAPGPAPTAPIPPSPTTPTAVPPSPTAAASPSPVPIAATATLPGTATRRLSPTPTAMETTTPTPSPSPTVPASPPSTPTWPCSPAPQEVVPGQFIAKMFSEALGQAPPQPRWQEWVEFFQASGCSAPSLRRKVIEIYTDPAYGFADLYTDAAARLLALYRGALNREPEAEGFLRYLRQPRPWETLVQDFLADYGDEFAALACQICARPGDPPFYEHASYGWDGAYAPLAPPTMPVDICGLPPEQVLATNSEVELRERLVRASAGQTVYLAQKVVVELTASLEVPPQVRLATCQRPGQALTPQRYALMGRLVRAAPFEGPLVILHSAGRLERVWIDGRRAQYGAKVPAAIGVRVIDLGEIPGQQTLLADSRLSDPLGWTQVQVLGRYETLRPCGGVTIGGNLLTSYATDHYGGQHADGLSIACENTTVEHNQIVDASDVSVVVFRCGADCVQRSQVRFNTILNAGNSAFGGFTVDPLWKGLGLDEETFEVRFEHNVLWTGPTAHMDIALSAGTRAWYGPLANMGKGPDCGGVPCSSVVLAYNTTRDPQNPAEVYLRASTPIVVSGMSAVCLIGNDLVVQPARTSSCSQYDPVRWPDMQVFASICCPTREGGCSCSGWASFAGSCSPPPFRDVNVTNCVRHVR